MKGIFQRILAILARATLWKYNPIVVGITGSVGKTSAKEAIFAVLKSKYRVRRSEKNYNTEIGVPLAILGIHHYGRNPLAWFSALIRVAIRILIRDQNFLEILVLEMGADRPGDIGYLVALAPPQVGVITAIGDIPVHVEFFDGPKTLVLEKSNLIKALPSDGHAVLNYDDEATRGIKSETQARVFSYGFNQDALVRITNYEMRVNVGGSERPGIAFKIEHGGSVVPMRLTGAFGKPQAGAAAAAVCLGLIFNMNLVEIAEALRSYESPPGRMKLLRGVKRTLILDDTYNASPSATLAAMEVLDEFPSGRRIAVLGDMLELGEYTETAHRAIGEKVAAVADFFIAVGERMKFALDEAMRKKNESQKKLNNSQTMWFARSDDVGKKLEELLEPGDVVLIKGSQGMRMEYVVKEIMAEPLRAGELLVRQEPEWLTRL